MATLIRRDPKVAAMFDLLGPDPDDPDLLPPFWNALHVGQRIVDAFGAVLKMPGGRRVGMASAWPSYMYEFEDLLAQAEQGELDRTVERQNKVRFVLSAAEIAHMEAALHWPAKHLSAKHPHLCKAVNAVALAHSLGLDAGWVVKKRGGFADTWRDRHYAGCDLIALGLITDRVKVF